jgi:hypothetical protein
LRLNEAPCDTLKMHQDRLSDLDSHRLGQRQGPAPLPLLLA